MNNEIHLLEAADNKSRVQWLQQLQSNRRQHYEKENIDDILKIVRLSYHLCSLFLNFKSFSTGIVFSCFLIISGQNITNIKQ